MKTIVLKSVIIHDLSNCKSGSFEPFSMQTNNWTAIILFFFLMISPLILTGQAHEDKASFYNWFDAITGLENSDLHYGIVYVERLRIKNKKSKFLYSPDFLSGSIIYDNLPYFELDLKYNAYEDEVLMRVESRFGGNVLQLYKNKINGFIIKGHTFIKIDSSSTEKTIAPGYYEVSMENSLFTLFIKHKKELIELLGSKSVYYEFEDGKKEYILWRQNAYYPIKNVSDLTTLFPNYKEEMNSFYKNQNANLLFGTVLDSMLVYLETLVLKENDKTMEK